MIKLSDKYQCSGCSACADVCPVNCIAYKHDTSGFVYPIIDEQTCIGCGACERVCPIRPENVSTQQPHICYATWAKDESIHSTSSSGGLGYALAQEILNRGGVVYGCSAEDPRHVRHIRVDNINGLRLLQGSKYVQSDTQGIYKLLKNDVKSGKDVLFIGTPCQASAVKNLYKRIPDNLYTVDLICHGVPSQQMLNEQIDAIGIKHHLKEPVSISFRKGTEFRLQLKYPDNKSFEEDIWHIPYYRAFFKGYSYRPSCYKCPYAGIKRKGDLTIGDFWGIKDLQDIDGQSRNGVSVVLALTPQGQQLLDAVSSQLVIQTRPIQEAVDGNDQLRHPVKDTLRSKFFRTLYPAVPLGKAVTICVADKKLITLSRIILRKLKI